MFTGECADKNIFKIGKYLAKLYKQEGGCLVHFVRLSTTPLKDEVTIGILSTARNSCC